MQLYIGAGLLLMCMLPVKADTKETVHTPVLNQRESPYESENRRSKKILPSRIRQLKAEKEYLLQQISTLPQHNPNALSGRLGYHSIPITETMAGTNQQINVKFAFYSKLDSIALMPALVSGSAGLESYAFPKRFSIEVLERRGKWIGGNPGRWEERRELAEWVEVVNWLDQDFPDPGPYPVFFECSGEQMYQVRISFPDGDELSAGTFHALGELFLFRRDANGRTSDNMMGWGKDVTIEASDTLSKPLLWDVQYLKDGFAGLGLPLSEGTADVDDLMISWEAGEPEEPVQIIMDLGEIRQVGGVRLWPTEAPYGMLVSLFGFPGTVQLELSPDPDFNEVRKEIVHHAREEMYGDNFLILATGAYDARYVRITLDDFSEYQQRRILGLGEIQVVEYNEIFSEGCDVSANGLPENATEQLPRLVDGFSRHRRILSVSEQIKGLAMRRPLDQRLTILEQELRATEELWESLQLRLSISGGGLLLLVLFLGWRFQRRQRKHEVSKLKVRITRDLHDEVGSSLGGISMMSEELVSMATDEQMREELDELSLMAREACSSLREVVWVTDQVVILLPALVEKMVERAERTLRGVQLRAEMATNLPAIEVALTVKRHLLMFFREAVHNCARHAGATEVKIGACVEQSQLILSIEDNGCGFQVEKKHAGWGVESMKKRAQEIGGLLRIDSTQDQGTCVQLIVPLAKLSVEPTTAYQTSNECDE